MCPLSPWLAAALKVRLLTAERGGDVARMRWSDLELEHSKDGTITRGWWTIPGKFTENSEPHRVPITAELAAIIAGHEPKDGEERGTSVFARDGGAAAADRSKKASASRARVLGIDFRGHDLRRTAATGMAESGVSVVRRPADGSHNVGGRDYDDNSGGGRGVPAAGVAGVVAGSKRGA